MRTLRIIEHVSIDGIVQGPGGPEEDVEGGFDLGGWSAPFADPAVGAAINEAQGERFDLLLGRKTYDIFASYWPHAGDGPFADLAARINGARKYVMTHRPESLEWGPVEVLGESLAEGVSRAKNAEGPDLIVWGSSTVTPHLIAQGLADEIVLLVFPLVLGRGKRLFSGSAAPSELTLVSSIAGASGVLINRYTVAGGLRTGSF